ncbi:hypothetical protein JCM12294_43390 [Desulfocicer niacini]
MPGLIENLRISYKKKAEILLLRKIKLNRYFFQWNSTFTHPFFLSDLAFTISTITLTLTLMS